MLFNFFKTILSILFILLFFARPKQRSKDTKRSEEPRSAKASLKSLFPRSQPFFREFQNSLTSGLLEQAEILVRKMFVNEGLFKGNEQIQIYLI
jgi:hypothetical protein